MQIHVYYLWIVLRFWNTIQVQTQKLNNNSEPINTVRLVWITSLMIRFFICKVILITSVFFLKFQKHCSQTQQLSKYYQKLNVVIWAQNYTFISLLLHKIILIKSVVSNCLIGMFKHFNQFLSFQIKIIAREHNNRATTLNIYSTTKSEIESHLTYICCSNVGNKK